MIKKRISITYILSFFVLNLLAQSSAIPIPNLPVVKPNIPATPTNNIQNLYPNHPSRNPHSYKQDAATITNMQQRNDALIKEVEEHQQMLGEIQRQTDIQMLLKGGFPSLAHNEGTANYYRQSTNIDTSKISDKVQRFKLNKRLKMTKLDFEINPNLSTVDYILFCINKDEKDITGKERQWYKIGAALADEFGEHGREIYHKVSKHYPKYNRKETNNKFDHCLKQVGYTIGTFFHYAELNGYKAF